MVRDIGIYSNSSGEYNQARTARAMSRMPPGPWLPDFLLDEVPLYPILNPLQWYQEDEMVPLHRCLTMLQYFDQTHGSEERRVWYLEERRRVHPGNFVVTTDDVPVWMVPRL